MTIEVAFAHFPPLISDRLILRQIQPRDADALFATFADEHVMRFSGHEPHRSLDETRRWIEQVQTRYARREAIRWGITLKDTDTVIGCCSLHHFDSGFHRAETGYELNHAYWQQGIMTEAMSAMFSYAFAELRLHRIEAIIDIENEPSRSLLRKLGFVYEGNLRQRYAFRDRFEDEYYFGLLTHEWHRPT